MAKSPFSSEKLIYRAVEDTPEDDNFLHLLQSDPWAWGASTRHLMKPQSKNDTVAGLKKQMSKEALLGVIICLPTPTSSTFMTNVEINGTANGQSHGETNTKTTPIGIIKLRAAVPPRQQNRTSSITIKLMAPYRGKGYGTEAIEWVLRWGFCVGGLHRISIGSYSSNPGAGRLYERLGFVPEGRERECFWFNGEWHDLLSFGMLEGEWRARKDGKNFDM